MTTVLKLNENEDYYSPENISRIKAVDVYAQNLDYGKAFAYLYRRFGNPHEKTDTYKDLAVYYLSTSITGVILCVFPHREVYPFSCLVDRNLKDRLYEEDRRSQQEFEKRFKDWCKNNNKAEILSKGNQSDFMAVRHWYFENVEDINKITGVFHKEVYTALTRTAKNLLQPVKIRDWRINILGKVE